MSTDLKTSNNYLTTLSATITSTDTTIVVEDASGLPDLPDASSFTYVTLISKTDSSQEILKITDITDNTLTVERGQDDTTAIPFDAGDEVRNFFNSAMFQYLASLTNGSNPGATKYLTITVVAGTAHTVTDDESSSLLYFTSNSDITVTYTTGYTAGHQLAFMQGGTGQITMLADSGVTFSDTGSVATIEQGSLLSSVMYDTDSFNFVGEQVGSPVIGSVEISDRTITIESSDQVDGDTDTTWENIQDKLDGVGSFIEQGVMLTIDWEDGTYDIGDNLLRMPDFAGGGFILCKAENATGPNTSTKLVNIVGTGSNVYSNFPPYNTTAEDENFLVSCVGSNLIIFGDLGITLQDSTNTGRNGAVFGGFCQLSFEDCWLNNEVSTGSYSAGVAIHNTATVNGNGNQIDVVVGHSEGFAAGIIAGGGGTAGIINSHTGSGDYTFWATNTGTISYNNNTATAAIATELPSTGGWYLPTDKNAIYA